MYHSFLIHLSADGYLGCFFPGGSDSKESTCNVGDLGWISVLGRSPGEWNDYPLQYSGLENSMNRSLAGYSLGGCKESDMTE